MSFPALWIRLIVSGIRLKKITSGHIILSDDDLLVFAHVRNELSRLPHFLSYYRSKGVSKFFFIDNNSDDGTAQFLLSQSDAYVFKTNESFSRARGGATWWEILLRKYGDNKWCLVIDIDEILVYPHWEEMSIRDLCRFLGSERKDGMKAMMLDMYADKFSVIKGSENKPLWEIFNYFDKDSHYLKSFLGGFVPYGGVRKRVFDSDACLHKIPLIKYSKKMIFRSKHSIYNIHLSLLESVLLHFKFDALFFGKVLIESKRGEYWENGKHYKKYLERINRKPLLTLYDPEHSVKFENSQQLVRMNMMKTSEEFEKYVHQRFSKI